VILRGGPGKILLPDGKEIGVTFDLIEIKFNVTGSTLATYRLEPYGGEVKAPVTEPVDGLEFGTV
jgi:hypothetical protein